MDLGFIQTNLEAVQVRRIIHQCIDQDAQLAGMFLMHCSGLCLFQEAFQQLCLLVVGKNNSKPLLREMKVNHSHRIASLHVIQDSLSNPMHLIVTGVQS